MSGLTQKENLYAELEIIMKHAYVDVHVIGGREQPDFKIEIDIVERKIMYHNATDKHHFYLKKVCWGILRHLDTGKDIETCTCIAWY